MSLLTAFDFAVHLQQDILIGEIVRKIKMADKEYSLKEKNHFYNCLLNSLVLFACEKEYFESLIGPTFAPLFELETEFDYAFTPIVFENGCEFGNIKQSLKSRLIYFKEEVDKLPNEIWEWDELYVNKEWIRIRQESKKILKKLGEETRKCKKKTSYNNVYMFMSGLSEAQIDNTIRIL